jgi:nucleoside-diphosphate-sugar epimerase
MTRLTASQLAATHTYSIEPAVRAFGYAPPVGADEALERTVAWWAPRVKDL